MRKMWILLILTLALCFGIGFGIGAYPQFLRSLRGEKPDYLVLLTSDTKLIPLKLLLAYEKATGHTVQLKEISTYHLFRTEAASADLLFAPLPWLNQFQTILEPLPHLNELQSLLSTDFISLKLELNFFLPVLWKTAIIDERSHLLIWGFATSNEDQKEVLDFLNFILTSPNQLRDWSAALPEMSFTLDLTNQIESIPESQRADQFRNVSLPGLIIDQRVKEDSQ
ncbi:MAG: hypothetical protein ACAH59_12955 [Pseudobdellovibrionaceae bacterium]